MLCGILSFAMKQETSKEVSLHVCHEVQWNFVKYWTERRTAWNITEKIVEVCLHALDA